MWKNEHRFPNRVFSYSNIERTKRNYSRKNFAETHNQQVIFDSCIFHNTNFHYAKITQCKFTNCTFSDFDFYHATISKNFFSKCSFSGILFYKCLFEENAFEDCNFEKSFEYPHYNNVPMVQSKDTNVQFTPELDEILKKALLHKHIRESNTLFKKTRNSWSKPTKRALKKISKNDGDKLGLSKKQRLAENALRKKQRNELHRKNYEDSQQGKNRVLDKGLMKFLLSKYTERELTTGLQRCILSIDFKFNTISYLIKYIDEANK